MAISPGGRPADASSLDSSPRKNWVEKVGGLPKYVRMVANALVRKGMPKDRAIPTAINTMRKWAAGGDNVSPKVQAAAAAALAEWEAKKGATVSLSSRVDVSELLDLAVPAATLEWALEALDLSDDEHDQVLDLAPGDYRPPYDWKHGFIPLTPAAAAVKAGKGPAAGKGRATPPKGKRITGTGSNKAAARAATKKATAAKTPAPQADPPGMEVERVPGRGYMVELPGGFKRSGYKTPAEARDAGRRLYADNREAVDRFAKARDDEQRGRAVPGEQQAAQNAINATGKRTRGADAVADAINDPRVSRQARDELKRMQADGDSWNGFDRAQTLRFAANSLPVTDPTRLALEDAAKRAQAAGGPVKVEGKGRVEGTNSFGVPQVAIAGPNGITYRENGPGSWYAHKPGVAKARPVPNNLEGPLNRERDRVRQVEREGEAPPASEAAARARMAMAGAGLESADDQRDARNQVRKSWPEGSKGRFGVAGNEGGVIGTVVGHTDTGMVRVRYKTERGEERVGTFNPSQARRTNALGPKWTPDGKGIGTGPDTPPDADKDTDRRPTDPISGRPDTTLPNRSDESATDRRAQQRAIERKDYGNADGPALADEVARRGLMSKSRALGKSDAQLRGALKRDDAGTQTPNERAKDADAASKAGGKRETKAQQAARESVAGVDDPAQLYRLARNGSTKPSIRAAARDKMQRLGVEDLSELDISAVNRRAREGDELAKAEQAYRSSPAGRRERAKADAEGNARYLAGQRERRDNTPVGDMTLTQLDTARAQNRPGSERQLAIEAEMRRRGWTRGMSAKELFDLSAKDKARREGRSAGSSDSGQQPTPQQVSDWNQGVGRTAEARDRLKAAGWLDDAGKVTPEGARRGVTGPTTDQGARDAVPSRASGGSTQAERDAARTRNLENLRTRRAEQAAATPGGITEGTARRMSDEQLERAMSRLMADNQYDGPAFGIIERELNRRDAARAEGNRPRR